LKFALLTRSSTLASPPERLSRPSNDLENGFSPYAKLNNINSDAAVA
jgi:hypothetical protein